MASPAQMAKRAAKQTAEILEALKVLMLGFSGISETLELENQVSDEKFAKLSAEIAELRDDIAILKNLAITANSATVAKRRPPAKK